MSFDLLDQKPDAKRKAVPVKASSVDALATTLKANSELLTQVTTALILALQRLERLEGQGRADVRY